MVRLPCPHASKACIQHIMQGGVLAVVHWCVLFVVFAEDRIPAYAVLGVGTQAGRVLGQKARYAAAGFEKADYHMYQLGLWLLLQEGNAMCINDANCSVKVVATPPAEILLAEGVVLSNCVVHKWRKLVSYTTYRMGTTCTSVYANCTDLLQHLTLISERRVCVIYVYLLQACF